MILTILIQTALVLAGITVLTLLFFVVVCIAGINAPKNADSGGLAPQSEIESAGRDRNAPAGHRAIIRCTSIPPSVPSRFTTIGYSDCRIQNTVFHGPLHCEHGCLGLGSCARICPNEAIILQKGTIVVTSACDGCGRCINVCPKKLISLRSVDDLTLEYCLAGGKTDVTAYCATAQKGYSLDFSNSSR